MPSYLQPNKVKEIMRSGACSFGVWVTSASPVISEIVSISGLDWVCIDSEHSPISEPLLANMILAIELHQAEPLVRIKANSESEIKTCLDLGSRGIIVPMIRSREEVQQALSYTKYPPKGRRSYAFPRTTGYGANADIYYHNANKNTLFGIMIENIDAVNNLDNIFSVKGIDVAMIGPYDLSGSMHIPGKIQDPVFLEAMEKIYRKCKEYKINIGTIELTPTKETIENHKKSGVRFLSCGIDTILLANSIKEFH